MSCSRLPPEQEHFAKGYDAYKKGDFASAVLYLKPLIEMGNPAAQLLMAKMYANGNGVPEDADKAELLRNLAAFAIYKKGDLTPGELRPANETLVSISKRLDYYVGAGEGKQAPVGDLSQVLESLDIRGIAGLQKMASESGETPEQASPGAAEPLPGVNVALPGELIQGAPDVSQGTSEPARAPAVIPSPAAPPAPTMPPAESSRGSDQISLSIIREAADNGDPTAMGLLSAAYAHGFYGLPSSSMQAGRWADKAQEARRRRARVSRDASQKIPSVQVGLILGIGIILLGGGVWLWWRNASR